MIMPEQTVVIKSTKPFYTDLSLWALLLSNLIVIISAVFNKWPLGDIIWVYWCQSVIIGIFWFLKMLTLRDFSVEGVQVNDRPVEATADTKVGMSVFFLFHYGFFHFIYFFFLNREFKPESIIQMLLLACVFFVYQGFSFFYNYKWQEGEKPNIGKLMFFPYARIIPIHLTIIFGGVLREKFGLFDSNPALLLFMLLKTFADVIMHIVENTGFGDKKRQNRVVE